MIEAMTTTPLIYPPSFSATADLAPLDCKRLDDLTADQRAELQAGADYILALNMGKRRRKFTPLPQDFRIKVAVYCDAKMTRKTGIPRDPLFDRQQTPYPAA